MSDKFIILTRNSTPEGFQLSMAGIVTRDVAHTYGVPHGAVQVAVVIQKKVSGELRPHILLHQRSLHKRIDPQKWDVCGGHLDADQVLLDYLATEDWHNPSLIEQLLWDTALREANEEIYFRQTGFRFQESHLTCFGQVGMFETGFDNPTAVNREYGSFFLSFVPPEVISLQEGEKISSFVGMRDTVNINGQVEDLEITNLKLFTLEQLMTQYREQPYVFADGITRVLTRLNRSPELMEQLRILLDQPLKS